MNMKEVSSLLVWKDDAGLNSITVHPMPDSEAVLLTLGHGPQGMQTQVSVRLDPDLRRTLGKALTTEG